MGIPVLELVLTILICMIVVPPVLIGILTLLCDPKSPLEKGVGIDALKDLERWTRLFQDLDI